MPALNHDSNVALQDGELVDAGARVELDVIDEGEQGVGDAIAELAALRLDLRPHLGEVACHQLAGAVGRPQGDVEQRHGEHPRRDVRRGLAVAAGGGVAVEAAQQRVLVEGAGDVGLAGPGLAVVPADEQAQAGGEVLGAPLEERGQQLVARGDGQAGGEEHED
ncbi:hypothetical protein [Nannocystis pusilla]|uniref:hypothetical protein n=1 Tax=Nannocystis pusilla TaxID=889268 RepID=UPI003DA5B741